MMSAVRIQLKFQMISRPYLRVCPVCRRPSMLRLCTTTRTRSSYPPCHTIMVFPRSPLRENFKDHRYSNSTVMASLLSMDSLTSLLFLRWALSKMRKMRAVKIPALTRRKRMNLLHSVTVSAFSDSSEVTSPSALRFLPAVSLCSLL